MNLEIEGHGNLTYKQIDEFIIELCSLLKKHNCRFAELPPHLAKFIRKIGKEIDYKLCLE